MIHMQREWCNARRAATSELTSCEIPTLRQAQGQAFSRKSLP